MRTGCHALGVDVEDAFYHDTWFAVARVTTYEVTEDFPAVSASALPVGISRVNYQIDLADLEDFMRSNSEVN